MSPATAMRMMVAQTKEWTAPDLRPGMPRSSHRCVNRAHDLAALVPSANEYNDHFFVLKMVIAEVHEAITGHAKGYFFNAEEARKIFTSDHDKKLLGMLYTKVKEVYQQEYEYHIANATTADQFVSSVHSKIMSEDNGYLKSLLTDLDSVHKKGMIHQLANKGDTTVVWSSNTKLDALLDKKGGSL